MSKNIFPIAFISAVYFMKFYLIIYHMELFFYITGSPILTWVLNHWTIGTYHHKFRKCVISENISLKRDEYFVLQTVYEPPGFHEKIMYSCIFFAFKKISCQKYKVRLLNTYLAGY